MSYKFLIISKLFLILILAHCIACHDKDKGKGHGGKGKGNEGDNGKGKAKKKRLIEGIDADYYAPTDTEGYTPQAMRKIMRYCTKKPNDPKCKDKWIITSSDQFTPDNPLDADNYDNFPEVKKYVGKKTPKYKIIDPLKGIPHKFKKKLPPGFSKKLRKKDIDAIRRNCPDDTCKQDKDYNRNLRATLAEYDVALNQLAYPDKPLDEIDEEVETKMERTYQLKQLIYAREGLDEFTKPADNGLFDDDCLLTLEQADALINQLNSSLEYSFAIPESQFNSRRKRAGDLLYFNTNPTKQWPIGQPIPYGFDKSLSNSQRENIRTCIRDIASKTCLTFTELDLSGSPPNISSIYFIRYITTAYCGISYVGVNYPYNPIYLTFLCPDMVGVACHEIMHALGVQHEHVRPDRDNSITVLWDNIDPQSIDSFIPSDAATFSSYGIPYHCDSIMHYSSSASAKSYPLKTMTAKVDPSINDRLMGQRKGLTQSDVDAINKLYCYPKDCSDNSNFCGSWATQGLCYCGSTGQPDCYMLQNCRNSCNFCNCTSYGI